MLKFILGDKGAGKTKWLIDRANEEQVKGNGNIVFVEVDDEHIFSLDYNVRLINATDYRLSNVESFYGFLCGLMAMDYDVEKIYVDGIYKVLPLRVEDLEYLYNKLSRVEEIEGRELFINVDLMMSDLPEFLVEHAYEVKAEA